MDIHGFIMVRVGISKTTPTGTGWERVGTQLMEWVTIGQTGAYGIDRFGKFMTGDITALVGPPGTAKNPAPIPAPVPAPPPVVPPVVTPPVTPPVAPGGLVPSPAVPPPPPSIPAPAPSGPPGNEKAGKFCITYFIEV